MNVVPWLLVFLNIAGVVMMLRYGLPKEVPWLGREDSDGLLGLVGLVTYGTSIAIRIMLTVTG